MAASQSGVTNGRVMTTAQAVVEGLIANGLKNVFCLPGVQNDYLFDAFYGAREQITFIHTRHEQGSAYMALGAAMATGTPSAYAVVPGPGFLNTTGALSTAYACNAPVMCLTGQIASALIGRGSGQLHEIPDQLGVMRSLTKWAERICGPQEAPVKIHDAFRALRSGRPRPVGIECALDVWARSAFVSSPAAEASADPCPIDPDAIEAAAKLLGQSKRPLIVVGGGAQDASAEVTAIAEALQAPVVAHRMGRGVIDSRNPLSASVGAGYRLWRDADVVLGVGTRLQLQLMQWGIDNNLKIVRIDADPEEIDRGAPPAVAITGDSKAALNALAVALERHNQRRASRADEMKALKAEVAASIAGLQPQFAYLEAIRAELPEDGIFVDEMTQLGYASRIDFPVYRPRTYLAPAYQGTLGWGVATALGAKAARPDVPVLSISGDGGFMFNVQELATAVQHRIPVVFVLVNDGAYGNVRRIQGESFGGRFIATELANPDFVKLAESFGMSGVRVTTPDALRTALRKAFAADAPALIEIPAGPMPSPWGFLRFRRIRPQA